MVYTYLHAVHAFYTSDAFQKFLLSFSDESFYFYYLGSKMHFKASKCANGNEDFYIKRTFEPLPPNMADGYALASKFKRDYELYKRK